MKICLVSREYPPETGWGGIGTYTYNLAHGLSNLGHEVHVISSALREEIDYFDNKVHVYRIKQRNIRGIWRLEKYFPIGLILYSFRVNQKIKELIKKYGIEIVEAPEWDFESLWYSFHKTIPLIIKLHTPKFVIHELTGLSWTFKRKIEGILERLTILRADYLTSPSKSLAEIISRRFNIQLEKISVLPNPVDEQTFVPNDKLKKENNLTVLYVGRLERRKGVHLLANAIARVVSCFPQVKFIFIGRDTNSGPNNTSMQDYIRSQVKNESNLLFITHLSREELVPYYQQSSFCVLPSIWENFAYTCLEAMSCGKPVVASAFGGNQEIINNEENGILIDPFNQESFSGCIINLLSDSESRMKMGMKARLKIENLYSRKKASLDTIKIYQEKIKNFNG